MRNILQSPKLLFFTATLLLWFNFSGHILSTLSLEKFLDGEFPSERFAFSRLVYNLDHGREAQGGFMLRYPAADALEHSTQKEDYAQFREKMNHDNVVLYTSHAGFQDDLVWPLWKGLQSLKELILDNAREGSRWHERLQTLDVYYFNLITQKLIALINALMLASFIWWAARYGGLITGWLSLIGIILFLPVLSFFGQSIWWMMWSWFLPMIIVLWGFALREQCNISVWPLSFACGLCVSAAIALKTLMGFEFVSTIMIAALVPLTFYAMTERWGCLKWFGVNVIVGGFALAGFIAAFAIYWKALLDFGLDPMDVIRSRFEMRSHGGETVGGSNNMIAESVAASTPALILSYLISPKELMIPQIILMAPFLWMLWKNKKSLPLEDKAFSVSIALSFIGAISMLVILKGHAFVHGFDIVIWYLPLNLFLITYYAKKLTDHLKSL